LLAEKQSVIYFSFRRAGLWKSHFRANMIWVYHSSWALSDMNGVGRSWQKVLALRDVDTFSYSAVTLAGAQKIIVYCWLGGILVPKAFSKSLGSFIFPSIIFHFYLSNSILT